MALYDAQGNLIETGGGKPKLPNVVFMGDSITTPTRNGCWVTRTQSMIDYTSCRNYAYGGARWDLQHCEYSLDNYDNIMSQNNTIWNQFNRLKRDTDAGTVAPDIVFIMCGTNDVAAIVAVGDNPETKFGTASAAFDNQDILSQPLTSMTTRCKSIRYTCETILSEYPACRIILASPPQNGHNNQTAAFEVCRKSVEDCAHKLGAGFIDTYGKSGIYGYNESVTPYYLGDGTHPTTVIGMTRLAEFFTKHIVAEA